MGCIEKNFVDKRSNFMSKEITSFCSSGIEIMQSPVNYHRPRKKSVLAYAGEDKRDPLERMAERALGTLHVLHNAKRTITPFEAHQGREAKTVHRNKKTVPTQLKLI